jgi:hypothetical protein
MNTYTVEADVGTVYATIEAESDGDAMNQAVEKWAAEAWEIFTAATFQVRQSDD